MAKGHSGVDSHLASNQPIAELCPQFEVQGQMLDLERENWAQCSTKKCSGYREDLGCRPDRNQELEPEGAGKDKCTFPCPDILTQNAEPQVR